MTEPNQGLTKQHALLALILAFPLGLMSAGFVVLMLINRPETSTGPTTPNTEPQPRREQAERPTVDREPLPKEKISSPVPNQSSARSEDKQIDDLADAIFWRRHPSLSGVKLSNQSGALAREWQQIRRCDAVVDYRFYQAVPQMRGRTIHKDQTALVALWQNIRTQVPGCS